MTIQILFTRKDGRDCKRLVTHTNVRQVAAEVARVSTLKMTRAEILGRLENDLKRADFGWEMKGADKKEDTRPTQGTLPEVQEPNGQGRTQTEEGS